MAAMIAEFEVDFAWLLQAVMHERAFKVTTTYPFPCMIFDLCRSAGVPIWNVAQLKTLQGTVDVDLIRDEDNELAPRRGPLPELPPLADDRANTVAQARTATQASTDTTPIESIPDSSTAPSFSRTAPLHSVVPLARVQKLEEQMVTLMHHIHPWMQKSITESEERLENIDTILEARVPESEAPCVEPAEDTVFAALFATSHTPPPPPRESAKQRRGRVEDEARTWKKERRDIEVARRASLVEDEAHRMRASELAAGASSSRTVDIAGGTTDCALVA
ncbi:hypothetical protein EJD97_001684 [Solanum chilense]|uniref:Integrase core domain containing protein n=1 Tax=Solanum chilense TaxID=4083 RepID=A0A6N2APH0_SOLCI|nr:hypothetical protein EJD97_001684 [Solanum chilense]